MQNAQPGDTIKIKVSGTITLTSQLPTISKDLTIDGPGASALTVSGANSYRVFEVDGGTVSISGLTVAHGTVVGTDGGAGATSSGGLSGGDAHGGGLLVTGGTVSINGVAFSNDSATGGNGGGGGPGSGVTYPGGAGGNGGNGEGGAVFNNGGVITVANCTFSNDNATGGTGGTGGNGGNVGGGGGGPAGGGGTGGNGEGGAVFNNSGVITIANCTFSNDSAIGGPGGNGGTGGNGTGSGPAGVGGNGGGGGTGGTGEGGAVFNNGGATGAITIANCTFSNDSTTGGPAGTGGNGGTGGGVPGGPGGTGTGAAVSIYIQTGTASALNVTLDAGNSATYGAISIDSVSPATLVADGSNQVTVAATVYDATNNPASGIPVTFKSTVGQMGSSGQVSSQINTNGNGQATDTITSTSAGTATVTVLASGYPSVSTDVSFTPGPPASITAVAGDVQSAAIGSTFATNLKATVFDSHHNPVSGASVTFTAPSSGAGGTFANGTVNGTVYSVTTDASGVATASTFTADSTAGSYTVTARVNGVSTPASFTLHNTTASAPVISGSNGNTSITTSDNVIITASALSVGQYVYYTTNGNTTFTGLPSSVSGSIYYQGPFSLQPGTDTVAAAVYTSATGLWGYVATATFTVNPPPVSGITVTGANGATSVANGSTLQMDATVSPANASQTVAWSVTPVTGKATISSTGLLTGTAVGTVTVTATATDGSGVSGSTTVTVTAANTPTSGGGGGPYIPAPVTSTTGSASVNPWSGGTVSLGNSASVSIPAGALQGNANATVSVQAAGSPPASPSGFMILGRVYQFTVNGQDHYDFNKPVTLTFTFDPSKVSAGETPAVYYYDDSTDHWIDIGGAVSGDTITVTVDHFTEYAVMAKAAAPASPKLTDIAGNWAYASIEKLVDLGAITGYPDGTFRPNNDITRAEFVTVLVKALKLAPKSGPVFVDTEGMWAQSYISTAAADGIVTGFNATRFGPNDLITREQMAAMVVRADKLALVSGPLPFTDAAQIDPWAREYVETAVKNGIIHGYPDGTFRPLAYATRAEAVTVIADLLK